MRRLYYSEKSSRISSVNPLSPTPPSPSVYWFTGLSGAGKTTLAKRLADSLCKSALPVEYLDGDEIRSKVPAIGFSVADRQRHIAYMAFAASRLEAHSITVIASFVSPFRADRELARSMCRNFVEIYVSTTLEVCEARDTKGLYRRARSGEIENFTGVTQAYEAPIAPEIQIDTDGKSIDESFSELLSKLNVLSKEKV